MTKPLRTALVIALCAHAAVATAFVRARPGSAPPAPASFAAEEREVSLIDSPVAEEATPATATATARASRAFGPGKHVVSAQATTAQAAMATATESAVVSSVVLVRESAPVLDLPSAVVPDHAAQSPRGATALDSVRAALDDHDRAIGLGTDSALVAAIRHAALGSRIPVKSSATLQATAGADGSVIDAEATNASSDIEAWNEVAAEVVRAMKGQRVRAVLGARGARLSFRVESLVRQGAGNAVAPSVRVGTPLYRCMEACTASGNIDPSDALLDATSRPARFVDVRALSSTRLD